MKKLLLLLLIPFVFSCNVSKELTGAYNMLNCNYSYNSISGLTLSGINVSNGISVAAIPKITSILAGTASSIPLNFTLNLNVNNPNQTEAIFNGMQYILSIDGIQFTSGSVNQTMNIAAGKTQTLPMSIGVDLMQLMNNNSKDAVTNIARNFIGIGSDKSKVTLKIKPTFMIKDVPVSWPSYIPVEFAFGGKK